MVPSPIDLAIGRVRSALEWRYLRPWNAAGAFWRAVRLAALVRAVVRGRAPADLAIQAADDFVRYTRTAGVPRTMALRLRRGRP